MTQPENVAAGLLARNLERCPDKAAFLCGDDTLTHRALAADSARFANLLRARGVGPGQRVVLVLPDSFAYLKAFLGAMLLGAVPVPVSAMLTPGDYAFILADCAATALVTWEDSPAAEAARGVPETGVVLPCGLDGPWGLWAQSAEFEPVIVSGDAPGFMLYSSGSTGRPKGVPHAQADLLGPAAPWGSSVLGVTAGDVLFSASKMSFAYGLMSSLTLPLFFGATGVLFPGKPGPYELFEAIARHRPSLFFCVPTLYNLLLRAFEPGAPGFDLSSLRLCYSAGEALPASLCQEWQRQTGVEILDGIGSTEAFNLFLSNRPGRVRCGASGEALPGFEVRLVSGDGPDGGDGQSPEVPDGTPGNLLLRGAGLARAYWERPEKTAETMLPGGWLATGDVYVREHGVFTHQGRSDDMLKVGAHWVSPVQVEDALRQHPLVAECAVAGLRVEGLLRPCAHVVLKDTTQDQGQGQARAKLGAEIIRHARGLLPIYMCPVRVEFHNDLPKTPTGKIQRFRLRSA